MDQYDNSIDCDMPNEHELDEIMNDCEGDDSLKDTDSIENPPPGTFENEPASEKPSQVPNPIVFKKYFPDAPPVQTPNKPKIQSTHADRYTTKKIWKNLLFQLLHQTK